MAPTNVRYTLGALLALGCTCALSVAAGTDIAAAADLFPAAATLLCMLGGALALLLYSVRAHPFPGQGEGSTIPLRDGLPYFGSTLELAKHKDYFFKYVEKGCR